MNITINNETRRYEIKIGERLIEQGQLERICDIYEAEMLLWNCYKKGEF